MRYLLLSSFSFLVFFIIFFAYSDSYGTSPSISHQKIKDKNGDWRPLFEGTNIDNCKNAMNSTKHFLHHDLDSINFFSNGETLNTTVWFNGYLPYKYFTNLAYNKTINIILKTFHI